MIKKIAIIGAGPAGLTAAYQLSKSGQKVTIFEADARYVGGISRTETYKGNHFDIGGHRFFSKSKEVEDFWTEILGDEMLRRPRSSRIFYKGKFFAYPLAAGEALSKLGLLESARCVTSYLLAKLFPVVNPDNFEDWVINQFGKRLYNVFFKTYTEKVWGIPCREISADWAAQRIKGLSLSIAIKNAVFKNKGNADQKIIKTLIDSFRYPRKGPGMMWEACANKSREMGAMLVMDAIVDKLRFDKNKWSLQLHDGKEFGEFDFVLSSAPLEQVIPAIFPTVSNNTLKAASGLSYRDFVTVILIMPERFTFTDNWIYIHDPSVQVGRIQNFKSWSPEMVADPSMACYGLEYFCFDGDGLWNMTNESLINLGKKEIAQIGLAAYDDIVDGYVVRQKKAYPVYDADYKNNVKVIREELKKYPGFIPIGRNGMHKYNNQDHSMMTAMLASRNILAGKELYDLWEVNEDADYHETDEDKSFYQTSVRLVPQKLKPA